MNHSIRGILGAFIVLVISFATGCVSDWVNLNLTIDISRLSAKQLQDIDTIEIARTNENGRRTVEYWRPKSTIPGDPALIEERTLEIWNYSHTSTITISIYAKGAEKVVGKLEKQVKITEATDERSNREYELEFVFSGLAVGAGNCSIESETALLSKNTAIGLQPTDDPTAPFFPTSDSVAQSIPDKNGEVLVVFSSRSAAKNGEISSIRIGSNGLPVGDITQIRASQGSPMLPTIARIESGYVVAWQETNASGDTTDVLVARLDGTGAPQGEPALIPTLARIETRPMIIAAEQSLALAWMDDAGTGKDPIAKIAIIDPKTLQIASGPWQREGGFPAIAYNGVLSVSWIAGLKELRSATLTLGLETLAETTPFESKRGTQQPRMTATGTDFLTVWEDVQGDEDAFDSTWVRHAYSGKDAAPRNTSIVQETGTGSANWPSPAWTGSSAAVAYYQFRGYRSQLFITRLSASGDRIDGEDFQLTDVDGYVRYPALTYTHTDWAGDHFGVAWIDDHTGSNQVYYRKVMCKKAD